MDEEKRLAFGLLSEVEEGADEATCLTRLEEILSAKPSLVDEPQRATEAKWRAWTELRNSAEGKSLLNNARFQLRQQNKCEAASWAAWLQGKPDLWGEGFFVEAFSPVTVVEWKWPLSIAVVDDSAYQSTQAALAEIGKHGPPWLNTLVRQVEKPADEIGVADIIVFSHGADARSTVMRSAAPISADLLLLCGLQADQFSQVAAGAEEVLALVQANAILATAAKANDMAWLVRLIEELSHNQPLDAAVMQMWRAMGAEPGTILLLSTPRFIDESQLSTFAGLLAKRVEEMSEEDFHYSLAAHEAAKPIRGFGKADALRMLESGVYRSESGDASFVSRLAQALPQAAAPPATAPVATRGATKGTAASTAEGRFLLHKISAKESTTVRPEKALEAGKSYKLSVLIGERQEGFIKGGKSFPEPPLRPEEAGASLAVVFFEEYSKPEGELRPVFLPRVGDSSTAEFEFTVSLDCNVFEGWVSVYHNNRLLQEGVLRARVVGAVSGAKDAPSQTNFNISSMPHPLRVGLDGRTLFGGTLRLQGDGSLMIVRGLNAVRAKPPGLKQAVDELEYSFNRVKWGDIDEKWLDNADLAKAMSLIAQQGWQLRRELCSNPLMKDMEASDKPICVYAADSNVRAPLELCYAKAQPKDGARICPKGARPAEDGTCEKACEAAQSPRDYVCPLGFWSLSKVLEWRSQSADSREDPEALNFSNEPTAREVLQPLQKVVLGRSDLVQDEDTKELQELLQRQSPSWKEVKSWDEWEAAVEAESPTLLLLMPHVDNKSYPPKVEIQGEFKDPPGIEDADVLGKIPQKPMILLLGCGAATALVDFQSLPAQFRRSQAAVVIAPLAELLARDAPHLAKVIIETMAEGPVGTRPFAQVLLAARRKLVAQGKLAGLLLLSFGDADWLV